MTADQFMTWAGWAATALCGAAAVYERLRSRTKDAATEIVAVLTTERDAWKSMTETVRVEMETYRKETHRKADEAHGTIVRLTEENARLKAATDVTPILKHQEEQSQINVKMLTALDEVLTHLRTLNQARPTKSKTRNNHKHP